MESGFYVELWRPKITVRMESGFSNGSVERLLCLFYLVHVTVKSNKQLREVTRSFQPISAAVHFPHSFVILATLNLHATPT